jgi:hypothetical protein
MAFVLKKFESEEERRFQSDYARKPIPFLRASLPITIVLYLSFLFWDFAIDPNQLKYTLAVRLVFCLIALAVFGLTFASVFERAAQPI